MSLLDATFAMRLADDLDGQEISRLAALDSATVPPGGLLLGLLDGRTVVAVSLRTGAAIADPFTPTAELVRLVRERAQHFRPAAPTAGRWWPVRGARASLARP